MVDQDSMVLDFNRVTEIESRQNITDAVIKGIAQSKRKIRKK
jgi:Skp family chaperone for outer membrane proteins